MKKTFKIAAVVLGAVLLLLLAGLTWASAKANARLAQNFQTHRIDMPVPFPLAEQELAALRAERRAAAPADTANPPDLLVGIDLTALARERAIARGKHLVEARYGCNVCHGANFAGGIMIEDAAIGSIHGPNITRGVGGRIASYTIADWDRIVRHGVKPDGSPAVMPSEDFFAMSDHELSDVVAYITSQPAVDADVPRPSFGPVGKVLMALGKFPVSAEKLPDHLRPHASEPPQTAVTAEFGQHLAAICTTCHRANLAGGPMPFGPPDWPAAANLTQHETGLKSWSYEDFEKVLTTGIKKDGSQVRPPMTLIVPAAKAMSPTERRAIWLYLGSVPAHAPNG